MKRNVRVLSLFATVLALVLLLSASLAGATQADPSAGTSGVVAIHASAAEQAAAASAWTHEARLAARPIDVNRVTPEQLSEALGIPLGDVLAPAAPDGTSGIFSAYFGNQYAEMWKKKPYRAVGKLFSNAGSCTASVIGPATIVTAAHCVFDTDTNVWYGNFSFCPAFKNGACPYGTFPWMNAWILTAYMNAPNFPSAIPWDVAVLHLGRNGAGRAVESYTGTLPYVQDLPSYVFHETTIGYPANKQSGKFSYLCASETYQMGTDVIEFGCNSGPGHSGGPIMRNFTPYVQSAGVNQLNSVVSYGYSSGPKAGNSMGGARFSHYTIGILCGPFGAPGC